MGGQVWFYMSIDDEREFMHYARSKGDVVLLASTSLDPQPETFDYPYKLARRPLGKNCHLWNRAISPRPKIDFVEQQNRYSLNSLDSEVIDVKRSKLKDNELSMGRLHIEDKILLPSGSVHSKSRDFLDWYEMLARWIRKNYKKDSSGAYFALGATKMIDNGATLGGLSV